MHEKFESGIGRLMNRLNLRKAQLARQHNLGETDVSQKFRFFDATDVALRAGMQFNRRNVKFKDPHILNDQRVDAGLVKIGNQALGGLQLIVMKNGVQRNKDFRAKAMGKRHQFGDIFQAVAGVMTRAEAGTANINGVRAV